MVKGEKSHLLASLRCWLVLLTLLSLSFRLLPRVFHLATEHKVSSRSTSSQAIRQQLDRDAAEWTPPVPKIIFFEGCFAYSPRMAVVPRMANRLSDQRLYNRPPPSLTTC